MQQARGASPWPLMRKGGRGPASCGLLAAAAATVLGEAAHLQIQTRLMGRGLAAELPIPRATKSQGVGSRKCMPPGMSFGFADVARLTNPGSIGISEIKPWFIASTVGRAEAMHYRLRADQSRQRLTGIGPCRRQGPGADDAGFALAVGGISATSRFDLLKGAIAGTEDFGPFNLDRLRNLYAKEPSKGAIGYWCKLNAEGEKEKKRKKDERKKKAEERKREKARKKKEAADKKAAQKDTKPRDADMKKDKGKPKTEPAKPKPETPAPKGGASGGNIGFGIAIFGSSTGGANAGVGISVGSDSAAVLTAGAGVSWFSDTAAAGGAGAGATVNTTAAGAGTLGVGTSEDAEALGAGTVGAGSTKGTTTAGAATAGVGTAEDSQLAGAGTAAAGDVNDSRAASAASAGSGKTEGRTGASTGSPRKPVDPKDVSGPGADATPAGESDAEAAGADGGPGGGAGRADRQGALGEGDEAREGGAPPRGDNAQGGGGAGGTGKAPGKSAGTGTGTGTDTGTGTGTDTGKDAGTGKGSGAGAGSGTGTATGAGAGQGSDQGTVPGAGRLGVLPVFPFGASDAQRDAVAQDAARVSALLTTASAEQRSLLEHLAARGTQGRYLVPTAQWIDHLLQATAGLTQADIDFLKTLDWTPSTLTAEQLRERIRKVLQARSKPSDAPAAGPAKPDAGPGAAAAGQGGGTGGGKGGGTGGGTGPGKAQGADTGDQAGSAGAGKAGRPGGRADPSPPTPDPQLPKGKGKPTGNATAGIDDRAAAPPAGADRRVASVFGFQVLSGLDMRSNPPEGTEIVCSLLIQDQGRAFRLDGVSITFYKRSETPLVRPDGTKGTQIELKFWFTTDFWSEQNKFYGRGGKDEPTSITFFVPGPKAP